LLRTNNLNGYVMMNILHINSLATIGGAAKVMILLHRALGEREHHSSIVSRQKTLEERSFTIYELTNKRQTPLEYRWRRLKTLLDKWFHLPQVYRSTGHLMKTKLFAEADSLHLHNLHGNYFNYLQLPGLNIKKPIVLTLHDMWALTGHCSHSYHCTRWKSGCYECPLFMEPDRQYMVPEPTLFDQTHRVWLQKQNVYRETKLFVVAPSTWLYQIARESMLSETAEIFHIPNGVNRNVFWNMDKKLARDILGIPKDAKVVLFAAAGLNVPAKGFSYLIAALNKLQTSQTSSPVFLLTMGNVKGSELIPDRFSTEHLGYIENPKFLNLAYNSADVLVMPSLAEAFGLVIIEALATGTPVVAFDVGGIPDMVRHMQTGYLARYKDAEDLANGICTLLFDDDLLNRMNVECQTTAKAYDLELQVNRYIDLYQEAIRQHNFEKSTNSRP
jgi:glycosyltransferase involved in cell wall biosynthesis